MTENSTVDKAISKGHKMVTYPGMLVMFGMMGLTFLFGFQKNSPVWIWPVGLLSSIILSWLFWSVRITKWKVWAFDNVRNVHELKKRAIQERLIWDDYSFFNNTEIWNSNDKQKWDLLQDKFLKKDEIIYENDLTLPTEKIIYYSKEKNLVEMIVMLGCLALGLYLILQSNSYVFGTILSLIGGYFAFKEFREATNGTPQIIISDKGIETINTRFYSWNDVDNEDVDIVSSGEHTHYYLTYEHPDGSENLLIDNYDIGYKELRRLLIVYRGRNLTKNNNH
jgi:hypothetical protein